MRPGEVVFKIETLPHPTYTRDGNNLKTTVKITLKQALLGFTKELAHLDDHVVHINKKKITKPGEVEKIKGEGMPMYDYSSE
jgi:DnaJ-class molecular chaperone